MINMEKKLLIAADLEPSLFIAPFMEQLSDKGIQVTIADPHKQSEEDLIGAVKGCGAQAVIAGSETWTRHVMEACADTLKCIVRCGTGYDQVDLQAATDCKIIVANTPGQNANAVAEMAFAHMICLKRKIKYYDNLTQNGGWGLSPALELSGKTIGLIGFGAVAQKLSGLLLGFGCRILAYDVAYNQAAVDKYGVICAYLEQIYRESDVISIHVPLLPSTAKMISFNSIAQMKDGVLIINTSRGGIVDIQALKAGLESGKVGGAGLDVHDQEPLPSNYPLLNMDNVILTPHAATSTKEAVMNMASASFERVCEYFEGRPVANQLNLG